MNSLLFIKENKSIGYVLFSFVVREEDFIGSMFTKNTWLKWTKSMSNTFVRALSWVCFSMGNE